MSKPIFETSTDERGNVSVRVSQEVQVLTHEEADRIAAEHKRLKDENAKLRELLREMWTFTELVDVCGRLSSGGAWNAAKFGERLRELGVVE